MLEGADCAHASGSRWQAGGKRTRLSGESIGAISQCRADSGDKGEHHRGNIARRMHLAQVASCHRRVNVRQNHDLLMECSIECHEHARTAGTGAAQATMQLRNDSASGSPGS